LLPVCAGCTEDAGELNVELRFAAPPTEAVYLWVRVEERAEGVQVRGEVLVEAAAPTRWEPGEPARLRLGRVPNGSGRVLVVEARHNDSGESQVVQRGVSERFSMSPGTRRTLVVTVQPVEAIAGVALDLVAQGRRNPLRTTSAGLREATLCIGMREVQRVELSDGDDFARLVELSAGECALTGTEPACPSPDDPEVVRCSVRWDLTRWAPPERIAHSVFLRAYDRFDAALPLVRRSVLRDDEPPRTLDASVTPADAADGATVTVALTVHEPLEGDACGLLSEGVGPGGAGLSGPVFAGPERVGRSTTYLWRANIGADVAEGTYGLRATLVDELGNRSEDPVADVAGAPLLLRVDRTALAVVPGSVLVRTSYGGSPRDGRARDGATLELGFQLRGPPAPGGLLVLVGDVELTELEPTQPGGGGYAASYLVRAEQRCAGAPGELCLPEGPQPVTLDVRDEAGNRTTALLGTVTVDLSPPLVAPGSEVVTYVAGPESLLLGAAAAATVGTEATFSFSSTENAATLGVRVLEPVEGAAAVSLEPLGEAAPALEHRFRAALLLADGPQGPYLLQAQLEDVAGNVGWASLSVPLRVDTVAPPAPGAEPGTLLHLRTPWGSEATDGEPRYGLQAFAGALEPGSSLIVYDSGDAELRQELGRARVDERGALAGPDSTLALPAFDLTPVFVVAEDGAGNRSAVVPVQDGLWTATLGGKVVGSERPNPHRFLAGARQRAQRSQGTTTELGAADGLASPDQDGPTTRGTVRWTRRDGARTSPSARSEHAAAFDSARGVTVLFGGLGAAEFGALGDTWELHEGIWELKHTHDPQRPAEGPQPRQGAAMAYDSSRGVVVLFGGFGGAGLDALGDTWEWDGQAWTERDLPRSPSARGAHALAYDTQRSVAVLFGGEDADDEALADTWEYDGQSWTRRRPARSPQALYRHSLVYDAARQVSVLFGGEFIDWEEWWFGSSDETWEWDGERWTERNLPRSPSARAAASGAYDPLREVVVLHGGETEDMQVLGDTWELDAEGWTRRSDAQDGVTAPAPRRDHVLVFDAAEGRSVLFGGFVAGGGTRQTWAWDGAWQLVDEGGERPFVTPSARLWSEAVHAPGQGGVLLFGGAGHEGGPQGDLWRWDGVRWRALHTHNPAAPDESPRPRSLHALAWDERRQVLVLVGGEPGGDETWEWDGERWTLRAVYDPARPERAPAPRFGHALAYDAARQTTLLFGGSADGPAETWGWDGQDWTLLHRRGARDPDSSPPTLEGHALAYDAGRELVVLYGGHAGVLSGQTWEWDGETWTRRDPLPGDPSPPPLRWHSLAYDGGRGVTVLFGGGDRRWYLEQTWEWDGERWAVGHTYDPALPGDAPLPRAHHALAYDAARDVTLLFAGEALPLALADTWELGGDPDGRPVHLLEIDLGAADISDATLLEMSARWRGGGLGYGVAPADCVEQPGLSLAAWLEDRWEPLASIPASPELPATLLFGSAEADLLARLPFGAPPSLTFVATPTAPNGCPGRYATLSTSYAEVTLRYRLP